MQPQPAVWACPNLLLIERLGQLGDVIFGAGRTVFDRQGFDLDVMGASFWVSPLPGSKGGRLGSCRHDCKATRRPGWLAEE